MQLLLAASLFVSQMSSSSGFLGGIQRQLFHRMSCRGSRLRRCVRSYTSTPSVPCPYYWSQSESTQKPPFVYRFATTLQMRKAPQSSSTYVPEQNHYAHYKISLSSDVEMETLGDLIGQYLTDQGDIVLLEGDLGAGKTTMARGIIRQLTGDPQLRVTSPTYLLDNTYELAPSSSRMVSPLLLSSSSPPSSSAPPAPSRGRVLIHHMDLYRLAKRKRNSSGNSNSSGGGGGGDGGDSDGGGGGGVDLSVLGLDVAMEEGLCLIEWPDRLGERKQSRKEYNRCNQYSHNKQKPQSHASAHDERQHGEGGEEQGEEQQQQPPASFYPERYLHIHIADVTGKSIEGSRSARSNNSSSKEDNDSKSYENSDNKSSSNDNDNDNNNSGDGDGGGGRIDDFGPCYKELKRQRQRRQQQQQQQLQQQAVAGEKGAGLVSSDSYGGDGDGDGYDYDDDYGDVAIVIDDDDDGEWEWEWDEGEDGYGDGDYDDSDSDSDYIYGNEIDEENTTGAETGKEMGTKSSTTSTTNSNSKSKSKSNIANSLPTRVVSLSGVGGRWCDVVGSIQAIVQAQAQTQTQTQKQAQGKEG